MSKKKVKADEPVRVGCTVVVVKKNKLLLGLRGDACETAAGLWALPGGRMDYGEPGPKSAVIREAKEETGLIIDPDYVSFLRPVNEFFPEQGKHYVSLVYLAWHVQGEPIRKEPTKCKEWRWFARTDLPKEIFAPTKETIQLHAAEIETAMLLSAS